MSQENMADRLRSGYDLLSSGSIDRDLLAPDFELVQGAIIDSAGYFRGRDAVQEALEEVRGSFDALSFTPEDIIDAGDGKLLVLVHATGRGKGSGLPVDEHIAHVWTFREGKAARLVIYGKPSEALKAVGLEE